MPLEYFLVGTMLLDTTNNKCHLCSDSGLYWFILPRDQWKKAGERSVKVFCNCKKGMDLLENVIKKERSLYKATE